MHIHWDELRAQLWGPGEGGARKGGRDLYGKCLGGPVAALGGQPQGKWHLCCPSLLNAPALLGHCVCSRLPVKGIIWKSPLVLGIGMLCPGSEVFGVKDCNGSFFYMPSWHPVHLLIHPSTHPFTYHPSIHPPTHLSTIHPSTHRPTHLSTIHPPTHPPIYLPSIQPSTQTFIYHPSICMCEC